MFEGWKLATPAVVVAALAAGGAPKAAAAAGGSTTGDLGAAGTAHGDISLTAGEHDDVGVDVQAGQKLKFSLVADFRAAVEILDPNGTPIGATFAPGYARSGITPALDVGGKYVVRISSFDGTQGGYTLTAAARWTSKFVATATSGDAVQFLAPAGAAVVATIQSKRVKPAPPWTPEIVSLDGPDGAPLLSAPIPGKKTTAHLPKTLATATGVQALIADGGPSGSTYRATISFTPPAVERTSIDLRNGLSPVAAVSFAKDGVARIFMNNCAGCHSWAWSYAGVRSQADFAYSLIRSGTMPLGGPSLPRASVNLVRDWIKTGENP
jgi:hypothetical protein